MPSTAYKGQSLISVMTLFFTNANAFANNELEKLIFTTENSNNIGIIPNSAISKIALYTNGYLFFQETSISSRGDMVTVDFSSSPLIIAAASLKPVIVKVNIANNATADSLKLNLKTYFDVTARDENSGILIDVNAYGGDSFPMRSGFCVIETNAPARRIFSSYIGLGDKACDIGDKNVNALQLVFTSTNSNVNEVQITGLRIRIEDINNNGIVPDTIIDKVTVQEAGGGIIYLQDNTIESSGDNIYLNLFAASIYISPVSSITLDIKLDINSATIVTNFHIAVIDATNAEARDKIKLTEVTNYAYPGFSFPIRGDGIDIAKYFAVGHDGSAALSQWERVIIKACNMNGSIIHTYAGTITLDTDGTIATISWTNNYSFSGSFVDGGASIDTAVYQFSANDKGVITLSIMDSTEESVNISVSDGTIQDSDIEGYLVFQGGAPEIKVTKSVTPKKARPYETITYSIQYTNITPFSAYDFFVVESLPTNIILVTNSAEISNSLHAGTATVYYSTNYTSTNWLDSNYDATNTVKYIKRIKWVLNSPINGNQKGILKFKTIVK